MKTPHVIAMSMLAGIALGAAAVQGLHAQAKPPGYVIVDNDVSNADAYLKEFAPAAAKALTAEGGKLLVRGGKTVGIDGAPPGRVILWQFASLDQAVAAYKSPEYQKAREIGDKYAKFHVFAVEGLAK